MEKPEAIFSIFRNFLDSEWKYGSKAMGESKRVKKKKNMKKKIKVWRKIKVKVWIKIKVKVWRRLRFFEKDRMGKRFKYFEIQLKNEKMGKYSNVGPILMAMNFCLLMLLFTMNTPSLLIKLASVFAFDFIVVFMILFFIDDEESGNKSILTKIINAFEQRAIVERSMKKKA